MLPPPVSMSIQRLLATVRRLEGRLRAFGLPPFLARLPVCWLCWHYCRMLDNKIARLRNVDGKFERWLAVVHKLSQAEASRLDLIDIDQSLSRDIEVSKNTMWELRGYCLDVAGMFERLGYSSARLQRRQLLFLQILSDSCARACVLQETMAAHDQHVLALLRAEQLRARAAEQSGASCSRT